MTRTSADSWWRALRRRKWQTVIILLREGQLDPEQHKQAVQQVSRFAKDYFTIKEVLKYTKEEEMECVLQQMLSRDMWKAVGHALEQEHQQEAARVGC